MGEIPEPVCESKSSLTHFQIAKRELALATRVDEVKGIRDKAEALRAYHRQIGSSLEMQNQCAEIKIRAERRAGELLKERDLHAGRPSKEWSHDATISRPVGTLPELGITRDESSRWQRIASVPEDRFEAHIAEAKGHHKELTTASVLGLAKVIRRNERAADVVNTSRIVTLDTLLQSGQCFGTIYADPPWKYGNQTTRSATDNHYVTMSVDEIAALPIATLAAEQSHLHLWTTNAFLFHAKEVIDAWGFTYKSCFVWVKPQMGIGNYWRVSHEFLLLGVRGNLTFDNHGQMSWAELPRTEHSRKPEAMRQIVEKVSPSPYLELFGRREIEGWTVWGNEVESDLLVSVEES